MGVGTDNNQPKGPVEEMTAAAAVMEAETAMVRQILTVTGTITMLTQTTAHQ